MENTAKEKNLLSALFGVPFSDTEQRRIAEHLKSNSEHSKQLRELMPRTRAYGLVKTKLKVPGGQPGKPLYNQRATEILLRDLGSDNLSIRKIAWAVYSDSLVLYLTQHHSQLAKLLREVKGEDGSSPEDLFRFICSSASEFGVPAESIRTFYELFWCPRLMSFDELLATTANPDPNVVQKRKVERLESQVASLETKLSELANQVSTSLESLGEELRNSLSKGVDEIKVSLETIAPDLTPQLEPSINALKGSIASIETAIAASSKTIDSLHVAVAEKAGARDMRAELRKVSDSVSTFNDAIKSELASKTEAITQSFADVRHDLENRTNSISAAIRRLESEVEAKVRAAANPVYQSPLRNSAAVSPAPFRVKTEIDLVHSWSAKLATTTSTPPTNEELLALHGVFLTSGVTVASDLTLVSSWLETMGWMPFSLNLVASPNWVKEQDWAQGAHHLFANVQGNVPRVLLMHNYDAAIPDCYLVPSLILWRLQEKDDGLTKIFLIPADANEHPVASVLEHASFVPPRGKAMTDSYGLATEVKWPRSPHGTTPITGVDPRLAQEWRRAAKGIQFDFGAINVALDRELPAVVVEKFRATAGCLLKHFIERDAITLALGYEVLPWVHAKLGEARCADLLTFVEQLV